ncbi:hypothetical protein M404DRAFT_999226, partial [Pisolithus tinctorius Marx 270]
MNSVPFSRRPIPDVVSVFSLTHTTWLYDELSIKYPSNRYLSLNPLRGRMVSQAPYLYEEKSKLENSSRPYLPAGSRCPWEERLIRGHVGD